MTPETTLADTIVTLTSRLTLEEKVTLLTGRDFWNTVPIDHIGLRNVLMSDGPSGVRGERWDEREPSLNLPSSTSLSSTWDRELANAYGAALASEARRKGVDVVLGPTINLHRAPYGGRHFECMSEDPVLSGALAAAYILGMQAGGVAATPKHYIANDFETDRFNVDVVVDDRTMRELYLRPFEDAVVEGRAWAIMSSYNSINGVTATEHDLLETPLRTDWGFDGTVISDWTAVRSLASAAKEQDIVMPGPVGPWGDALVQAVRNGEIAEAVIDRKIVRILTLAAHVGALSVDGASRPEPSTLPDTDQTAALARRIASAGSVLVRNQGFLPLDRKAFTSVAVIGDNAVNARTQGGGSATVLPVQVVTPLAGIINAVGAERVTFSLGAVVQEGIVELPVSTMTNPVTGQPGVRATFRDAAGVELFAEDRRATAMIYFGGDAPIAQSATLSLHTSFRPGFDGVVNLGFAGINPASITVDGTLLLRDHLAPVGMDLGAAFLAPPATSAPVSVRADQVLDVVVTVELPETEGFLANALAFTWGQQTVASDSDALIAEAVEAARAADIAVVVVGTTAKVESEGWDRTSLALPGRQDDLVRAVAAANPRTLVVVNSGSPVLMPWRNDVAAVLLAWFGGQSFGDAIADVMFGDVEPGGRLPTTWPVDEESLPVGQVDMVNGKVTYSEGIHIGYRAWMRAGSTPAYPFGFGLGYTTWSLDGITAPASIGANEGFTVRATVTNTGARAGRQVVQVYLSRAQSAVDRPVMWLAGFGSVTAEPGATVIVDIPVRARELAYWDNGWTFEPGTFSVRAGFDVADAAATTRGAAELNVQ